MRKTIATVALAGSLALVPAVAASAAADDTAGDTPTQEQTMMNESGSEDDGNEGLWGLAGLLGLVGLAGLKRRDHHDTNRHGATATGPRATDR